jgi:hypothetical protein
MYRNIIFVLIIRVIILGNCPAMTTFNKNMRDPNLEFRLTSEKTIYGALFQTLYSYEHLIFLELFI